MPQSRHRERPSSRTARSRPSTFKAMKSVTGVPGPALGLVLIASPCRALHAAIQALGEALKQNSSVTSIMLCSNRIGKEGAKARFGCQQGLVLIVSKCCAFGAAVQALGEALTTVYRQRNDVGKDERVCLGGEWGPAPIAFVCFWCSRHFGRLDSGSGIGRPGRLWFHASIGSVCCGRLVHILPMRRRIPQATAAAVCSDSSKPRGLMRVSDILPLSCSEAKLLPAADAFRRPKDQGVKVSKRV